MKRKRIFTLVFILILVFSVAGPAMADEGDPPVDCNDPLNSELEICLNPPVDCDDPLNSELEECLNPPEEPDLEEGTEGFEHPLLALFSAYYVDKTTIDCEGLEDDALAECLNPPVDCSSLSGLELAECLNPPVDCSNLLDDALADCLNPPVDCSSLSGDALTACLAPPVDCSNLLDDALADCLNPPVDCEGLVDPELAACLNPPVEPEFGEVIGELHDEGIGFGVLSKLMMISFDSQECVEDPETEELECNPVTFDDLFVYYQDGLSMGQIFEDYGKPDIPGVGGLKNADKREEKCPEDGSGPPGLCKDKDEEKCPEDGSGPPGLCKDEDEEKCPEDGSGPPGLCKDKDEELP